MNERIFIADKKPEAKTQNPLPQIRRRTNDSQSFNSPVDRILFLQRMIGNQAVQKLVKSGTLQAKLRIGQPGDVYEQEADRVAEQVMKMPDVSEVKDTRIQRKCPKCLKGLSGLLGKDKKEEKLQAKETSGKTLDITSHTEANINALKGGGQPLPESTRAFFEPRFGRDFSQVRVHTDTKAAESAQAVNALAYTMGRDVVFGTTRYSTETAEGKKLLAHELSHVVQQDQGVPLLLQCQKKKKATGSRLTFAQIQSHITSNNNAPVSTELLLCLIWKESDFDPKLKNPRSSATGLMQVTRPAVNDVNRNTPKGVHFKHSEMTDPAKNIACGTHYLKLRSDRAGGDVKKGLEGFGTGSGYADNILDCETCLKGKPSDPNTCLHAIHP